MPHSSVEAELSVVMTSRQDGPVSTSSPPLPPPPPSRFKGRVWPLLKVNTDHLPRVPTGTSQLADFPSPLVREGVRVG